MQLMRTLCALMRKIRGQELSPVRSRGLYTPMGMSELYRVARQNNEINGSTESVWYMTQNSPSYVKTIKIVHLYGVCYCK